VRFELSRSALDAAAARVEAGNPPGPGWIGLMPVESVRTEADGSTLFVVSQIRPPLGGVCGLAHNDVREPFDPNGSVARIADGWWIWCDYPVD
jgi:hypothetical protein